MCREQLDKVAEILENELTEMVGKLGADKVACEAIKDTFDKCLNETFHFLKENVENFLSVLDSKVR
jgi:hypothetical protein